jgi:hypothetical protein
MKNHRLIRIETSCDAYVSFGSERNPPAPNHKDCFMMLGGQVQYFMIPKDGGPIRRLSDWLKAWLRR